jgi:hypothetical protein
MLRRLGFALDSSLAKPSAAGRVGIASRALLRKIHRSQYLKEDGQLGAAAHGYFGIRGCLWLLFSKILNLGPSVNSQPGASMRILFDQGVPGGLTAFLRSHDVTEARKLNWEKVSNGALLRLAEVRDCIGLNHGERQFFNSAVCPASLSTNDRFVEPRRFRGNR